jgi:hypothetical protein
VRVTTTTTAPPPGQPQLESILVQLGDLPTGWTASAGSVAASRAADATAFAQCVGVQDTGADVAAAAASSTFVSGTMTIASSAISLATSADVASDSAALVNPKAAACYVQVLNARLKATLPKTSYIRTPTFKITPRAATSPANVVATGTGTIGYTLNGKSIVLNDTIVFVTGPRVEAHVDFYYATTPVPAAVMTAVVAKVAARVAATP